jgi:hypothetical protein
VCAETGTIDRAPTLGVINHERGAIFCNSLSMSM